MINSAVSASTLLSKALSLQRNVNELSAYLERGPAIVSVLEDALSGKEVGVDSVIQNMNEQLGSSSGERVVSNEDVMVLALYVLQVLSRRLVESTLDSTISEEPKASNSSTGALFVVGHPATSRSGPPSKERRGSDTLKDLDLAPHQLASEVMNHVCVGIYESVQDACMRSLSTLDNKGIVRRCVGILSGRHRGGVWGHQRPCEVIISSLCRFTVPKWHGYDTITDDFSLQTLSGLCTEPNGEVFGGGTCSAPLDHSACGQAIGLGQRRGRAGADCEVLHQPQYHRERRGDERGYREDLGGDQSIQGVLGAPLRRLTYQADEQPRRHELEHPRSDSKEQQQQRHERSPGHAERSGQGLRNCLASQEEQCLPQRPGLHDGGH